ncbi:MAG: GntR family transcriptional regulator [Ruminococcaceae bacterium]|nr:GntR family transcriptional regulator [Oscillospiraceae bacterium]
MEKFRTVSLADQVFEKLEDDIITGVYARGEIITELKLVETLGVSRTPVREALRRLEHERLVQETGKGTMVLGITQEDLIDIMDIRMRIEGLAAAQAAQNRTQEDIDKITSLCELQDYYFGKNDLDHLREVDDQFHDLIYDINPRSILRDTLVPLHKKTQRFRRISIADVSRLQKTVKEHKAIGKAIIDGDAELACKLMEEHIANAKDNMIARLTINE